MTIAFTRLFTTQGLLCGGLNEVNVYRGTTVTDRRDDLVTQLATNSAYAELVATPYTYAASAQTAENAYVNSLGTLALAALQADVEADRAGAGATLASSITELDRQMRLNSQSLNACPGTVTNSDVGTPAGDHQFVWGTYEGLTGKITDFLVPDVYLIRCTRDRSTGATAYRETFSVVGKPADASDTDASYPSGTGINATVTAVDPASDESIVSNGGFDDWATNTPDDWTLVSGTVAGTNVFQKTADDPRGTAGTNKSLRLVSTGALIKLRQEIDVEPSTAYTAQFRVKDVADPGTDWAVSLCLVDGDGTDIAGNGAFVNRISSAAAGSLAANWTNVAKGQFCTPAVLPSTGVFVEIRMHQSGAATTAPASGAEAYVDHVSIQAPDTQYIGGPSLVVFSGLTEGVVGDTRTATVALSSGTVDQYLIRGMDRLLGLAGLAVRLPTVDDASETQADSLVA